jgi:hypothetical protein
LQALPAILGERVPVLGHKAFRRRWEGGDAPWGAHPNRNYDVIMKR